MAVLAVGFHMLSILYFRFAYHKFYEGNYMLVGFPMRTEWEVFCIEW